MKAGVRDGVRVIVAVLLGVEDNDEPSDHVCVGDWEGVWVNDDVEVCVGKTQAVMTMLPVVPLAPATVDWVTRVVALKADPTYTESTYELPPPPPAWYKQFPDGPPPPP
jgi:hypothetical protein